MLVSIFTCATMEQMFAKWKAEGKTSNLVAGAWSRPLFVGGWQHTGDHTESVFNVQVFCWAESTLFSSFPFLLFRRASLSENFMEAHKYTQKYRHTHRHM